MNLEDKIIVDLYWDRDEAALSHTAEKYGRYLGKIAANVLGNPEDEQEVVNDTYLRAWNTMPDQRPDKLSAYLGRITRGLAIDRYRAQHSKKRFNGQYDCSLEELAECVNSGQDVEESMELKSLTEVINRFLHDQKPEYADVFLCRYYYMDPLEDIAAHTGFSISKIKSILHRMRKKLRAELEKEGFTV